ENQTISFYVDFLKLNYPHGIYNNKLVSQIIKFEKIISPCEGLDVSLLFSDQSELDIMICFNQLNDTNNLTSHRKFPIYMGINVNYKYKNNCDMTFYALKFRNSNNQ